jgi:hypothetical protein
VDRHSTDFETVADVLLKSLSASLLRPLFDEVVPFVVVSVRVMLYRWADERVVYRS